MIVKDVIFGFELNPQKFNWKNERPKPPQGYIEFNSNRAHCQSGKCPNCGHEKPGIIYYGGGFQDRMIQNLKNALDRLSNRLSMDDPHWKPDYEFFWTDIDSEQPKQSTQLNCHPSRYGIGEFYCCKAKIWHDFHSDIKGWKYYYKSTAKNKNTLQQWC